MQYRKCVDADCERNGAGPGARRGLCSTHYNLARKANALGEYPKLMRVGPPAEERFWAKVDKTGSCWEWTGAIASTGYGVFAERVGGKNTIAYSHRLTYEKLIGPIPEGLQIDHLCRNRSCCNPEHLEPVTPRVNMLRGNAPTAIGVRIGQCKNGHAWVPENIYIRPDKNSRMCKACNRIRQARRAKRKKEAA